MENQYTIPGCATQGETFDELLSNIYEAVESCISVDVRDIPLSELKSST
jgi:predicted RNase H-like HicB family nuclease